ncbi:MAG: ferrous iron transport protein B [Deltaproteobacteria bacterium]|nr:MAG: ferrous iron transport protein B [Deltaproteobacteria bacterium]
MRATAAALAHRRPLVALVGNPNTGKTLLFNRLTGSNARVGNYPGITVERRTARGELPGGVDVELLDVPGAYSLSARSAEEQVAIRSVLGWGVRPPDLVVLVVDATQLLRNLYLVLQVRELGLPCVIALNMVDEVEGARPDPRAIEALFGVPCVPVSARTREGIDELRATLARALHAAPPTPFRLEYPPGVEADVEALTPVLRAAWQLPAGQARAMALWALTSLDEDDELADIPDEVREAVRQRRQAAGGRDIDQEIIGTRYAWLDAHAGALVGVHARRGLTERVDRVLLHPVAGFGVFVATMLVIFQSLFSWSDPFVTAIESLFEVTAGLARTWLPESVLTDLFVEGIIGGVGNVVVFLPQILLLFFFVGVMEDSGYMARAAYLMDRVMKAIGLHGRAFVPMLSGYACAVPAIMATRTMERQRDRLLTMMVIPFMTCSARLPVYTLIIAALFPPRRVLGVLSLQGLMMMAMYLFGTMAALVSAAVLGRTVLKGRREPLLLELPPIRLPSMASVGRLMLSRGKVFLTDAGTVILACTVLLWGLLSFPKLPEPGPDATHDELVAWQAESLEASYAGQLGKAIEPVIAPLGFDWKIGVGLIGAFAAREVFVSTMGLVYGVGEDVDESSTSLRERMQQSRHADGRPVYTPRVGLSLMVFIALAAQCMSTLAAVKRETGGYRWPVFMFAYMTAVAWVASFVVYQVSGMTHYPF